MPQSSATLQTVPQFLALTNGGTTTSTVQLVADTKAVWSDASVDTLTPGTTAILSAYAGSSPTIDTSAFVWLVFLIKGASPLLLKEIDFPTIETALSGAVWFLVARIDGPVLAPYHTLPAASSGGGATPVNARAHASGAQTLPDSVETVVNFNSVDFDSASAITTGSGWQYTVPTAGVYRVTFALQLILAAPVTSVSVNVGIQQNGTDVDVYHSLTPFSNAPGGGNVNTFAAGDDLLACRAGDTIAVVVGNFTGSSIHTVPAPVCNFVTIALVN